MEKEITVKVKVPTTGGKETTLTLEGDEVEIRTPASWGYQKVKLDDLRTAVGELSEGHPADLPVPESRQRP